MATAKFERYETGETEVVLTTPTSGTKRERLEQLGSGLAFTRSAKAILEARGWECLLPSGEVYDSRGLNIGRLKVAI